MDGRRRGNGHPSQGHIGKFSQENRVWPGCSMHHLLLCAGYKESFHLPVYKLRRTVRKIRAVPLLPPALVGGCSANITTVFTANTPLILPLNAKECTVMGLPGMILASYAICAFTVDKPATNFEL